MKTLTQTVRKNGVTFHQGRPSQFLTICDNILEQINSDDVCVPMALDESVGGSYTTQTFDAVYSQMMSENCRSTFRLDRNRNRIEVPYGATFRVGKNGNGVAIKKGWSWKEDLVGQVHALEPGFKLKIGLDGKGVPECIK